MNKKGMSSVMLMIVVIILGLLALTFGFLFFGTTGEKIQEKFDIFVESTEPSCSEKCVLEGYRSGACVESTPSPECAEILTGYCEDKICCCRQ